MILTLPLAPAVIVCMIMLKQQHDTIMQHCTIAVASVTLAAVGPVQGEDSTVGVNGAYGGPKAGIHFTPNSSGGCTHTH